MKYLKLLVSGFLALVFALAATSSSAGEFCWRDSYGRGAGTIPTSCPDGKENFLGLCYDKCKEGSYAVGSVCWSQCPKGYRDMGAVCHIDMPLLVEPGWACAQKVFGVCIWPKTSCRSGYTNIGLLCALTSAGKSAPPGFSGTFLDPMKNSYPRAPSMPNCGSKQNQAGLCYEPCKPGYTGVGPVCWGNAPPNWVECGMGAAKDKTVCEHVVFDQVASVGNAAIKIATMGSTDMTQMQKLALSAGIITAKQLSHTAIDPKYQLKLMQKGFQTFYETALLPLEKEAIKQGAKLAGKEVTFPKPEFVPEDQLTPEDIARISASIAGMADPTGLVSMGANYTYPKCSKYFGDPK